MFMFLSIVLMVGAYLAGSINFSILLFNVVGKEDPRQTFSGNPGATNVYRQAGIGWAAAVLLLDMGRAMGVAYLGVALASPDWVPWMGLALIVGNRYPCFLGFGGG
jgi:glycerol-3-phosphate acyltransferase PlsY